MHYLSIAILILFAVEIILKVYAFRCQYFTHIMEVFDGIIVVISLVLDIIFIRYEDMYRFLAFVIALRLWRIFRVIHGMNV